MWIFGFLTFLAVLHTFDAVLSFTLGSTNSLLNLNPFYGLIYNMFGEIDCASYFWVSIIFAFILFGMSCAIAFHDPIATFINKVVSDAKTVENPADVRLESGLNIFEMVNDSVTSNNILLNKVKDSTESVRNSINNVRTELSMLGARLRKLETDLIPHRKCPSCGKNISQGFKVCPYCGEKLLFCVQISTVPK
ncbi:MAG: zinc-ribbon domain-containing protein [Candidatus Bathyarchaeota archaeon]|nr:MAG: zinc-ribbon domain-containing protein [Candidatus Bathyarchaeota archaeon]